MTSTVRTTTPEETATVAASLAEKVGPGALICLTGDLGAGKSVFARALGAALGVTDRMPSPTFTIIHEYEGFDSLPVIHADLYRVSSEEEFELLALEEQMVGAVTIVEWPERAPRLLRDATVIVEIRFSPDDDHRTITINWTDADNRD